MKDYINDLDRQYFSKVYKQYLQQICIYLAAKEVVRFCQKTSTKLKTNTCLLQILKFFFNKALKSIILTDMDSKFSTVYASFSYVLNTQTNTVSSYRLLRQRRRRIYRRAQRMIAEFSF